MEAGRREVVKAGWLLMQAEIGYSLSRLAVDLSWHRKSAAVKGRIADPIECVAREIRGRERQVPSESSSRSKHKAVT